MPGLSPGPGSVHSAERVDVIVSGGEALWPKHIGEIAGMELMLVVH
ncbi:MAG: hypothetical protein AABY95_08855 [Pseudomonadota bacterium]